MHYALDKLDGTELDGRRIKLVEEGRGRGRYIPVMGSGSEFRRLLRIRTFCENGSEKTQKICL